MRLNKTTNNGHLKFPRKGNESAEATVQGAVKFARATLKEAVDGLADGTSNDTQFVVCYGNFSRRSDARAAAKAVEAAGRFFDARVMRESQREYSIAISHN